MNNEQLTPQNDNFTPKGKVRSFGKFIGLLFITCGIYYFYWLYANINEVKTSFKLKDDEKQADIAMKLLAILIALTIIIISASTYTQFQNNWVPSEQPLYLKLLSLISCIISALFYYFFTKTIAIGQEKANVTTFTFSAIYSCIAISILLSAIGNLNHSIAATAIGSILSLIYIYTIQKQANKIWKTQATAA